MTYYTIVEQHTILTYSNFCIPTILGIFLNAFFTLKNNNKL